MLFSLYRRQMLESRYCVESAETAAAGHVCWASPGEEALSGGFMLSVALCEARLRDKILLSLPKAGKRSILYLFSLLTLSACIYSNKENQC